MVHKYNIFLSLFFLLTGFAACVPSPYYQESKAIKNGKWHVQSPLNFTIDISDSNFYYNTYLIVRHSNNYGFSNIWLNIWIKGPGERQYTKSSVDFLLATPQGQWLGKGMGEIYEQRRLLVLNHSDYKTMPLSKDKEYELLSASKESFDALFHKKGLYHIKIEQNMRENVLSDILNIGLRVERYHTRTHPNTKAQSKS